jgi:universal stress protein A
MQPRIRTILVPVDFSPPSDYALTYAKALGDDFGASLHLLHVVEDPLMTGPWPVGVCLGALPRLREEAIEDAESRILECVKSIGESGREATGEVLIGSPFQAIVDLAFTSEVDLIVMGTHGRTGIPHLVIGSVAERVIRHAACPVLVVREHKAAEHVTVPVAVAG